MQSLAIIFMLLAAFGLMFWVMNITIVVDLAVLKNRSAVAWFILAAFYGPLATFLIHVAPAKRLAVLSMNAPDQKGA